MHPVLLLGALRIQIDIFLKEVPLPEQSCCAPSRAKFKAIIVIRYLVKTKTLS